MGEGPSEKLAGMPLPDGSARCLSRLPQYSGEFTSHVRCVPVGVQRIGGSSLAGSSVSGSSFSGLSLSGIPLSGIPLSGIPVSGIPGSELFGHHSPRSLTSGLREFPSQRLPGCAQKEPHPAKRELHRVWHMQRLES